MDKLNFDISNQVNKGFELVRQGKLDKAEQLFSKVLMSKAEEENSLLALGIINYEKKRFQIAKVYLEKVVAKQPNNFKAYLFLGLTEVALNEINKAVSAFLEAIKIQPDFVESIVSCADAYKKLRCYDEAIEFYEKAMKLQPSNPVLELACAEACFFRGRLYFQKEELQFALANFSKAYEFGKKDVECLYNLAETYRLLQESEKALELYEQILVVAPNSISTLVAKGVLLKDLARYKESKDTLNKGAAFI